MTNVVTNEENVKGNNETEPSYVYDRDKLFRGVTYPFRDDGDDEEVKEPMIDKDGIWLESQRELNPTVIGFEYKLLVKTQLISNALSDPDAYYCSPPVTAIDIVSANGAKNVKEAVKCYREYIKEGLIPSREIIPYEGVFEDGYHTDISLMEVIKQPIYMSHEEYDKTGAYCPWKCDCDPCLQRDLGEHLL
jgi:hypothetical protein